jgi:regulatory protein
MAPSWKSTASKSRGNEAATRRTRPAPSGEALLNTKGENRSLDAAKQAAYRILSYQDRTSHEMDVKLRGKGFSEEIVSKVIQFLHGTGVLNDLRFARQWARSRTEYRHFGPVRLRRELLEKGVPASDADAVLEQLSEERDPVAAAEEALIRRFREAALLEDPAIRRRAFSFLQRKGFATETILKAFKRRGAGDQAPEA